MKRLAAIVLVVMTMVGCNSAGWNPSSPQEQAALMLDYQIVDVKDSIARHQIPLPQDRLRWAQSDVIIIGNLYRRLDDLYRQRQLLAVELSKQSFDPAVAFPSEKEDVPF